MANIRGIVTHEGETPYFFSTDIEGLDEEFEEMESECPSLIKEPNNVPFCVHLLGDQVDVILFAYDSTGYNELVKFAEEYCEKFGE